jgi:glutamyl-tRNA synthetase
LTPRLQNASWTKETLEPILNEIAAEHGIGFGKLGRALAGGAGGADVTPRFST